MLITVFTPTYNRSNLLSRLYESLCLQTFTSFEWLIGDDGSTDNTEQLIAGFINENKITIRYFKQENGGKHRAINRGVKEARGELFFIVDSDDRLPLKALEVIADYYYQIEHDDNFAGICGLKTFFDGRQVGGEQDFGSMDCSMLDIRYKYHIRGDMAEVVKTDVMRQHPFPEYDNERFCPEALVWNRIAQRYVMRYFHEPIYECEYQQGGLTDRIVRIRMESPRASMECYRELSHYNISFQSRIKSAINYWRFAACSSMPFSTKVKSMTCWLWLWPIGMLMHARDKK